VPCGAGNFFEGICQFLRKQVAEPAMGEHTDLFIKYIWTAFFFVLFSNVLGLIPFDAIFGLILQRKVHIGGTSTGNIWVTATLAICTLLMIVVNGFRIGGRAYLAHFCPGPIWLAPLLVPVELIGLVAKIFALSVRLFANMLAGHVLLAVLIGFVLMAYNALGVAGGFLVSLLVILGSVAINLLELFVAFLQAFIFTFLTALFIGQAVSVHHEQHGEHGEPGREHAH
jgi:F-type H+-transporting ATPase subunit a